ncbi:Os06g0250653, partial [Oryza sativa Japonica Group]
RRRDRGIGWRRRRRRPRTPQRAEERVAPAQLPPASLHGARAAAVDGPADVLPSAAGGEASVVVEAQAEAGELGVVGGGEGAVEDVAGEVVPPPVAALRGRAAARHLRRHAAPVAGAVLHGEALQDGVLLGRPRRREPEAEDA